MAPPKTMAVSQQQQQQQSQSQTSGRPTQADQASKSRKKKGKQQQQQQQTVISAAAEKQQVTKIVVSTTNGKGDKNAISDAKLAPPVETSQRNDKIATTPVTPNERISIIKKQEQQQSNQVPSSPVNKKDLQASSPIASATVLAKQISNEEPDDIDAGIELDGSSNSGSSVKDINEDHQIKSASVSPVMAQNNLVKEVDAGGRTKHAAETGPIEQLAGSLCHEIAPSSKKAASLTIKQQLAANQQVIDADEQLLQQKLQNKQRKPSLKQANMSSGSLNATADTSANNSISQANTTASSQGAVTPQSPALCKICEQHVYQMERMMAEKAVYHKGCFRCYQCKIQLRIDNYSSHEGHLYCKAHHRQLFQPQVKLDTDDVDIVAKSNERVVDDYLLHRGRLSDLSFKFLQPKPEEIQKRQMIICENEPAELPKDVVRSDTKVDDGIERLNLNLNNILERFERGNSGDDSQPSSAGVNIEKPSFNIRETLKAFETRDEEAKSPVKTERPTVRKLNLNGFLNQQNSGESEPASANTTPAKPLAVRRSESLMLRLKKYESRIAGEQVADDDSDEDENNNSKSGESANGGGSSVKREQPILPKKLSSLKSQWENGDISKRRSIDDNGDQPEGPANSTSDNCNEELISIRQELARKRSGGSSSIKNIYENAIKEAQKAAAPKLNSSDLSALNGFSTTEIQQQLLHNNNSNNNNGSSTLSSPDKDHFQLNLSKKANKLRERFEQGLINNNSTCDDSDEEHADGDSERNMSKLDQIRQEKLEDLSIFTEGEIKAREARSMFQRIDRRLSEATGHSQSSPNSRSLASISASMQAKLQSQRTLSSNESLPQNGTTTNTNTKTNTNTNTNTNGSRRGSQTANSNGHLDKQREQPAEQAQKPIRLVNNVRT